MTYRIVRRNGWYIPQERVGESWTDFVSADPNNPVVAVSTLGAARTLATAGPVRPSPEEVVEEE